MRMRARQIVCFFLLLFGSGIAFADTVHPSALHEETVEPRGGEAETCEAEGSFESIVIKGVVSSRLSCPRPRGHKDGGVRSLVSSIDSSLTGGLNYFTLWQAPNGLWLENAGDTALVLLAYFARGERPGRSKQYSETLIAALTALIKDQFASEEELLSPEDKVGYFRHRDPLNYTQLLAANALLEVHYRSRHPSLVAAVRRALEPILAAQNDNGGWNVNFEAESGVVSLDFTLWAVTALRTAYLCNPKDERIRQALKRVRDHVGTWQRPDGSFPVTYPSTEGDAVDLCATAAGTLLLQWFGEGKSDACAKALDVIQTCTPPVISGETIGTIPPYTSFLLMRVYNNLDTRDKRFLAWIQAQNAFYKSAVVSSSDETSVVQTPKEDLKPISFWFCEPKDVSDSAIPMKAPQFGAKGKLIEDRTILSGEALMAYLFQADYPFMGCEWTVTHLRTNAIILQQLMVYYWNTRSTSPFGITLDDEAQSDELGEVLE